VARCVVTSERLAQLSAAPELVREGHFSPAVVAGPFVFVSGIAARDLTLGIEDQASQVFEYLVEVLAQTGARLDHVVKLQAFLADAAHYRSYSQVRRRFFPADPPASTAVVTQLLLPGMLVEVDAVAYRDDS